MHYLNAQISDGSDKCQKQHGGDKDHPLGTGRLGGYRCPFQHGEDGGALLNLGLGSLQLCVDGGIGVVFQLHVILDVLHFHLYAAQCHVSAGISHVGILLAHLFVFALGLGSQFLVVFVVGTHLVGTIVRDEYLQAVLDGVGQTLADQRVLGIDADGDDARLLVDDDINVLAGLVQYVFLLPRQVVRVVALLAAASLLALGQQAFHPFDGVVPPRLFLVFHQVVVVGSLDFPVLALHHDLHETAAEAVVPHQVWVEQWRDGIRRLHAVQVQAER